MFAQIIIMSVDAWGDVDRASALWAFISPTLSVCVLYAGKYAICVAKDGAMIPWFLHGVDADLKAARAAFEQLSPSQKQQMEELRSSSERSLESLIREWQMCVNVVLYDEQRLIIRYSQSMEPIRQLVDEEAGSWFHSEDLGCVSGFILGKRQGTFTPQKDGICAEGSDAGK
jgi:hypothetical protein